MAGLRGHVARQGDHRRRAEQAVFHARGREPAVVAAHREIAGGDQLAAGGGGDAVDARDHRLRQAGQRGHHGGAAVEQGAHRRVAQISAHLLEVVAGAERLAGTADHHHPGRGIHGDPGKLLLEQAQQRIGQAVVGLRTVERQAHHAVGVAAQ